MHAAFPAVSLFKTIISTSLLSKNSGNESFSGMNWMRDFSYSNRCENDFERYYLTEKSEKCLCCGREFNQIFEMVLSLFVVEINLCNIDLKFVFENISQWDNIFQNHFHTYMNNWNLSSNSSQKTTHFRCFSITVMLILYFELSWQLEKQRAYWQYP